MTFDQTVLQLVGEGLREIDQKYGPQGHNPKTYHNADHAQDVMRTSQQLAELAYGHKKIDERDKRLITLAGCYHDINQDLPRGEREDESIRILVKKMKANQVFTKQDIAKVSAMIDATKVKFVDGKIIQNYTDDYLTKILADSDLSAFGKPFDIFWDRALKVATDNGVIHPANNPDFIKDEITLLQKHQFASSEAETLFPNKAKNITRLKQMLKRAKATNE